ncbi:MAG: glycosyltransferase [Candidatus Daviesbacteria bacterium]|nr:glycosyltransferase [Candidatus Daviesbacteria bacterium]
MKVSEASLRVAIVHDDLVQWGGAERVLEGICKIYPVAPIFTSVFDKNNPELFMRFRDKEIHTSFLQKIPGWKILYKALLPFYPIAFEQFNFDDYDLVISHTTRFAKGIITKPETKHICYCHTPPRFLWHLSGERNFGLLEPVLSKLRLYDAISAKRVDLFLAGSKNAQRRIKKIYQAESCVVYPFVDVERFARFKSFNGNYFLVVSRLNKYKKIDLAIKACLKLKVPLKIIGSGSELDNLKNLSRDNNLIEFMGNLSDEKVAEVMSGCRALIICGEEDFGLTSLEAQALGKPVIAARMGGTLETVLDGATGLFFDPCSVDNLIYAMQKLTSAKIKPEACRTHVMEFSFENFQKAFREAVEKF